MDSTRGTGPFYMLNKGQAVSKVSLGLQERQPACCPTLCRKTIRALNLDLYLVYVICYFN